MKIQKRDGTMEDFDKEKVARVVLAAGLTSEQANQLAGQVDAWIAEVESSILSSLQIRDKVLEYLRTVDMNVANLYEWYEDGKDTT